MKRILLLVAAAVVLSGFGVPEKEEGSDMKNTGSDKYRKAVLGGGCFWCLEAVYEQLPGVIDVVSGYAGGKTKNPTYKQVCTGLTGHAEVVEITYDPDIISYKELLKYFWKAHDPTQVNRQGADVGTQYRSIILYTDDTQKNEALEYIALLEKEKVYYRPIVTQVEPLDVFYPAEAYHQDYYANNKNVGYCQAVIAPKLEKLDLQY